MRSGPRTTAIPVLLVAGAIASGVSAAWAGASVVIKPNGPGEGESSFVVKNGAIRSIPATRGIVAPSTFRCNKSNLYVKATAIPIVRGRINFAGQAYADKFRAPSVLGTLTWKGTPTSGTIRFQTKKSLVVSGRPPKLRIVNRACDTGTLRYGPRVR